MKLYCVVIYVTSSYIYMADTTAVQMEGFGILFIPLSANFFVDICLCYHKSNDTYYVRIKMMEFVPYVQWPTVEMVVCTGCLEKKFTQ